MTSRVSPATLRVGHVITTERSAYLEAVRPEPPVRDVREIIAGAARIYGVDPAVLLAVAWCESRYNPRAIGDHGESWGVMQFKAPTFLANARRAGLPYEDAALRLDAGASAMVASWMFSTGGAKHWTCARTLGFA